MRALLNKEAYAPSTMPIGVMGEEDQDGWEDVSP
jgi:hypothetical protein